MLSRGFFCLFFSAGHKSHQFLDFSIKMVSPILRLVFIFSAGYRSHPFIDLSIHVVGPILSCFFYRAQG